MNILYQYTIFLSKYSIYTQRNYYRNVEKYIRYLEETKGKVNNLIICNVTRADICNYIAYMDNLSVDSKVNRLIAVKNFYKFLGLKMRHEILEDIKIFNKPKRLPHVLSWSQTINLINYYTNERNRFIIYLLLTTGMRLNEISNLKTKDINLKEKYIRIIGKGNKERVIPINDKVCKEIQKYMDQDKIFNLSKQRIYEIVKKALVELGYKGSTHTLRHTAATIMYKHTRDILLVKEFLGHSRLQTTQIYTHIDNEEARAAVNSNPLADWGC